MAAPLTPVFVRLPKQQASALTRLADATGWSKQHLISELLADRLTGAGAMSVGRVEISNADTAADEVLTLEETAALLKLSPDAVRVRAEQGDVPGRLFGNEWRFARVAILAWLAEGERREPSRKRDPREK